MVAKSYVDLQLPAMPILNYNNGYGFRSLQHSFLCYQSFSSMNNLYGPRRIIIT